MTRAPLAMVLAACCAGGVASCSSDPSRGYSFASTYQGDISAVSVRMFDNRTYSYGLEQQLTEAIVTEMRRQTPWNVVDPSVSQATLSGTITKVELRKLSTGRISGMVEEQAIVLTVDFEFKDVRTGKALTTRRSFAAGESFVPARGVGERIGTGEAAAVQSMAKAIVNELRSGW